MLRLATGVSTGAVFDRCDDDNSDRAGAERTAALSFGWLRDGTAERSDTRRSLTLRYASSPWIGFTAALSGNTLPASTRSLKPR